jgi:hypothetical protein
MFLSPALLIEKVTGFVLSGPEGAFWPQWPTGQTALKKKYVRRSVLAKMSND